MESSFLLSIQCASPQLEEQQETTECGRADETFGHGPDELQIKTQSSLQTDSRSCNYCAKTKSLFSMSVPRN